MWLRAAMSTTSRASFRVTLRRGFGSKRSTAKLQKASVARGFANVGEAELRVARPAVVQHFADELEGTLLRPNDGLREVIGCCGAAGLRILRSYPSESAHKGLIAISVS